MWKNILDKKSIRGQRLLDKNLEKGAEAIGQEVGEGGRGYFKHLCLDSH